jgi:7-keto-8-aminopelargonate synthetase-like enzyme
MGATGRGLAGSTLELMTNIDIMMGTFTRGFGGMGWLYCRIARDHFVSAPPMRR